MNDQNYEKYGYFRELSREEKLNMIEYLENDIMNAREMLNDKKIYGELRDDLHKDILFDEERLKFLKSIIDEKQL